jgi:hypothetical protein
MRHRFLEWRIYGAATAQSLAGKLHKKPVCAIAPSWALRIRVRAHSLRWRTGRRIVTNDGAMAETKRAFVGTHGAKLFLPSRLDSERKMREILRALRKFNRKGQLRPRGGFFIG